MQRRNTVILSSLIIVAVVCSAYILFTGPAYDYLTSSKSLLPENSVSPERQDQASDIIQPAVERKTEVIRSDKITVENNSPEYDLKVLLYQNSQEQIFLKLDYYIDGSSIVKEFGVDQIPELKYYAASKNNLSEATVWHLFLNTAYGKAYIPFEYKQTTGGLTLYAYDLKSFTLKSIFRESDTGKISDEKLSADMKYLTLTLEKQEASNNLFVLIVSCDNDESVIKEKAGEITAAANSQTPNQAAGPETNANVNADSQQGKVESEPVKALKGFYSSLAAGQYKTAHDILDDDFRLRLNMFKQFGMAEVTKADLDLNEANREENAIFINMLKSSKIDGIIEEKLEGTISSIYYYQFLKLGDGEPVRLPLVAVLKNTGNVWKLQSASEGNINEKPYKR